MIPMALPKVALPLNILLVTAVFNALTKPCCVCFGPYRRPNRITGMSICPSSYMHTTIPHTVRATFLPFVWPTPVSPCRCGVGQVGHDIGGWVKDHQKRLTFAYSLARQRVEKVASRTKHLFNRRAKALPLLPGERVWVRDRNRRGKGKL